MKHVEIEVMENGDYKLFINHQFIMYGTFAACLRHVHMEYAALVPS